MEVEIGKERLKFENGAFTYYGVSALTLPSSGEAANCRKMFPHIVENMFVVKRILFHRRTTCW